VTQNANAYDPIETRPVVTPPERTWLYKAWRFTRLVLLLLLVAFTVLTVGVLILSNATSVLNLSQSISDHFWVITGARWTIYGLLIGLWPNVARMIARIAIKSGDSKEKRDYILATVLGWRSPLARALVVYELLFPLNLAAWLGGLI